MKNLTILLIVGLSTVVLVTAQNHYPVDREKCGLAHDRGTVCTGSNATSPQVMFHFDKYTGLCLAFKYNGCNGNENRFETASECRTSCMLQDFGTCALFKEPFKHANGSAVFCGHMYGDTCPTGYRCKHLAFFGKCCEEKNEHIFEKNFSPKCAIGKAKTYSTGGFNQLLVGKSCADDFCPVDHKCNKLEVLAHCCPK